MDIPLTPATFTTPARLLVRLTSTMFPLTTCITARRTTLCSYTKVTTAVSHVYTCGDTILENDAGANTQRHDACMLSRILSPFPPDFERSVHFDVCTGPRSHGTSRLVHVRLHKHATQYAKLPLVASTVPTSYHRRLREMSESRTTQEQLRRCFPSARSDAAVCHCAKRGPVAQSLR